MADRPTRNSSRRTTPQAASKSPPQRALKTTRSQSRDISDGELPSLGPNIRRRGPKRGSKTSSDPAVGESAKTGRLVGLMDRTKAAGGLSTVAEDQSDPQSNISKEQRGSHAPNSEQNGGPGDESVQKNTRSSRGSSLPSGTPAEMSRSGLEPPNLNSDELLDVLEELSEAADKVLNWLVPQDISIETIERLRTKLVYPNSRESKKLFRLSTSFKLIRDHFGTDHFISKVTVLRNLSGTTNHHDVPSGHRPADLVLHKINFATLTIDLLTHKNGMTGQWLEELDKSFPRLFIHGLPSPKLENLADWGALFEESFELALDIRTHCFIKIAERTATLPDFDPSSLLREIFLLNSNSIKGRDSPGLQTDDILEKSLDIIEERVKNIEVYFSAQTPSIALKFIEAKYPFDDLIQSALVWIRRCLDEVNAQVEEIGGVDALIQGLEGVRKDIPISLWGAAELNQIDSTFKTPSNSAYFREKPFTFNLPKALPRSIASLKRREAARSASKIFDHPEQQQGHKATAASQAAATTSIDREARAKDLATTVGRTGIGSESSKPIETWQSADIDDSNEDSASPLVDPQKFASQTLITHTQMEAESNKENLTAGHHIPSQPNLHQLPGRQTAIQKRHWTDRQENAQKVTWDSQESETAPNVIDANQLNEVRPDLLSQDDSEDISQDEGFQEDQRLPDFAARRNQLASIQSQGKVRNTNPERLRKRARMVDTDTGGQESTIRLVVNRHNRQNDPTPTPAEVYEEVNAKAKSRVQLQAKPIQSRTPWSHLETETLLDLIEEHGLSWSSLKIIDGKTKNALVNRDQVALKDKARNMKVDYLKVGTAMPLNFAEIPLNKAQRQKLESLGIGYDPRTGRRVDDFGSDDET
ncbi:MAG: hypothetical protein Q9214_002851 [Letrouitia sp. 1 TL-2023]